MKKWIIKPSIYKAARNPTNIPVKNPMMLALVVLRYHVAFQSRNNLNLMVKIMDVDDIKQFLWVHM